MQYPLTQEQFNALEHMIQTQCEWIIANRLLPQEEDRALKEARQACDVANRLLVDIGY